MVLITGDNSSSSQTTTTRSNTDSEQFAAAMKNASPSPNGSPEGAKNGTEAAKDLLSSNNPYFYNPLLDKADPNYNPNQGKAEAFVATLHDYEQKADNADIRQLLDTLGPAQAAQLFAEAGNLQGPQANDSGVVFAQNQRGLDQVLGQALRSPGVQLGDGTRPGTLASSLLQQAAASSSNASSIAGILNQSGTSTQVEALKNEIGQVAVHKQHIDQAKVATAEQLAQGPSDLPSVLTHGNLNQAERDKLIQYLARNDPLAFYRANVDTYDVRAQAADQAVIGRAVQQAYADGAINKNDLLHIADAFSTNMGTSPSQRFLDELIQGGGASLPGSAAETLANALWNRNGNDGADRAVAAMYYTSDSSAMQRDLGGNSPAERQKRLEAFEALVNFNQTGPYSGGLYSDIPGADPLSNLKNQAIAAEANLFAAYGQELTSKLGNPNNTPQLQVLAEFMSQAVVNPSAQNIQLNDGHTLKSDMSAALKNVVKSLLEAQRSSPHSLQPERELAGLGAALAGGVGLALKNYDAQVQANDASRQEFADLVGGLVGNVIPDPLGDVTSSITSQVLFGLSNGNGPEQPPAYVATTLHDRIADALNNLSSQRGEPNNLSEDFNGDYGAAVDDLQLALGVNLGGFIA
jgi:hypothetical protein